MLEISSKNKIGYLLYSPVKQKHFFRIYQDGTFIDYDINAEEIEIKILDDWTSLYESENYNKLDFSSKTLGKE